jgi:hypothetical protein
MEKISQLEPAVQTRLLGLMDVSVVERVDESQPAGIRFVPIDTPSRLRWASCALNASGEEDAWDRLIGQIRFLEAKKIDHPMVILEDVPDGSKLPCFEDGVAQIRVIGENSNRTEIQVVTDHPGSTVYEIASKMKWSIRAKDWNDFPITQKWFAVGEASAQLDYLLDKGLIKRELKDGKYLYFVK